MEASDATRIESWICLQLKGRWPDAECLGHENRDGDYYFSIRSDGRERCLIVPDHAYHTFHTFAASELTEFLENEHWLHRLKAERYLCVQAPGIRPSLVRPQL